MAITRAVKRKRSSSSRSSENDVHTRSFTLDKEPPAGTISGFYIPPEILLIILDFLSFEERTVLTVVNSQLRHLALQTLKRLKVMKDLQYCAPAPSSITAPGWLEHRVASPATNMYRLQLTLVRCSTVLTYLNLLGTNILNQDLMSWIYHIDLPELDNIKFPNGHDVYICLLRDLAISPTKWSKLSQISIGFGSKLEISEECLDLIRLMRQSRPALRSNVARCRQCQRLYFTDSRVKCVVCMQTICSQHFTRAAGNHCILSIREKCPHSGLKFHRTCRETHSMRGCYTLDEHGQHWPCYKPMAMIDYGSTPQGTSDQDAGSDLEAMD